MRAQALEAARLDAPGARTCSTPAPAPASPPRGSSSASTPARVTMLDQSPHQLARARAQARAGRVPQAARRRGAAAVRGRRASTATCRPGASSTGPTRSAAIAEAHRVLREGGTGVVIGPVEPANPILRRLVGARGCCSRPRPSTAPGSSGPASRTSQRPRARARLVPRPLRLRRRGQRRQARRRRRAAAAAPPGRGPRRAADARRPRALRRALRARLGRRARVRADRRRARAARPAGARADGRRGRRRRPRPRGDACCGASRARTR